MAKHRSSFIGGIDQDTSKSKYAKDKYFSATNIKVLTEEGLSSGNIENEDGNSFTFSIPDVRGFYKIKFNDPNSPTAGTLTVTYTHPTTGIPTVYITPSVDTIDELLANLNTGLSILLTDDLKIIKRGEFIYMFPLSTTSVNTAIGTGGLSDNTTTFIGDQSNLKIIGWTTLRDEVVVFTTNETSETPTSVGQIWKFKYDPTTLVIDDIQAGNELSPFDHLMYNQNLDFSTHWHIGNEAIGHYENSEVGSVYWTDEYNELRSANLLDPELLAVEPETLNVTEQVEMSIPVVSSVQGGGALPHGAVVQYAYRLFSPGGNKTTVSPVCNPINLGGFDPSSDITGNKYWQAHGTDPGTGADKSVTYTISDIDTNFTVIEHIAILRSVSTGVLDIYKFAEEFVPADGNLTVTHSDRGLDIEITDEELTFLTRTFRKCKTIAVKDKRLLAGNVSTEDVTVDNYDSRAYRFNSAQEALVTDNELSNVTLNGPSPTWTDVPEEHDAINPYNVSNDDATDLYRFQADGTTWGGEGPNISYTFNVEEIPIKEHVSGINLSADGLFYTGEYDIEHVNRNGEVPISGTKSLNGEVRSNENEFQNLKSPTMAGAFTGYARGEVYRFAIVFYDLTGNPFNAKWIGDIKIPEAYDDSGTYSVSKNQSLPAAPPDLDDPAVPLLGNSIGISFNVDVSSIQSRISGYEIVRVKRDTTDRTRLGTGIVQPFTNIAKDKRRLVSVGGSYSSGPAISGGGVYQGTDSSIVEIDGDGGGAVYTLSDHPAYSPSSDRTMTIISPTSIMKSTSGYTYLSGDTIKTVGFYRETYEGGSKYQLVNTSSDFTSPNHLASVIVLGREAGVATIGTGAERRTIVNEQVFQPGEVIESGWYGPDTYSRPFLNTSASTRDLMGPSNLTPAGIGDTKQLIDLDSGWTYFNPSDSTNPDQEDWWREISYERIVQNQYGGDTFESRASNTYIATGSFLKIDEFTSPSTTQIVYGGDSFVHMFAYQAFHMWFSSGSYPQYNVEDAKYHLGFTFPCESPINATMQKDGTYGDETIRNYLFQTTSSLIDGPRTYSLPEVYNSQNDSKNIFFPKGFVDTFVEENPHRIWASNSKIDGELLDSWKVWLPNNFTEVDGQYGEINKIITIRDKFYFYQDRAFGTASINDRSVITDEDGVSLTLGTGGILDDYGYISRHTGTTQKFSVVTTGIAVHHFDTILKKWMRYSEGSNPISDIRGLHSFFLNFDGDLLKDDRLLKGTGIHGIFDKVRNKVYMTFLNATQSNNNYTIAYNENLQMFESFYDNIPNLWLEADGKLISSDADNDLNNAWLSYEGNKNSFYGTVYPSTIELIITPNGDITNIFDTIEYKGEISINDIDQTNLTFNTLRVLNDHQDSGVITLTPNANVIRKFRSWRTNIPRDTSSNNPRMRDYFIKLILTHTPNSNERLVLHDIITNFRPYPH